jgi:hypothetical protein
MYSRLTRRRLLSSSAALAAGGLSLPFLGKLTSAAAAPFESKFVQLAPDIAPLVSLIEDTPREELLPRVAAAIKIGATYNDVLSALFLAGVKNIRPRPVGFKFHAVLVVNSAHLASQAAPDDQRWLPIFWALDNFKNSQAADVREGDWTMPAPADNIPAASESTKAFNAAMDNWEPEAADRAVISLARGQGQHQIFERFFRYGARDFRDIGHKAIFVANTHRALGVIGWRHAEPILRSLTDALLEHEGENPAKREADADMHWRRNEPLAKRIPANWLDGRTDDGVTRELVATFSEASSADACAAVVAALEKGIGPQSIWDALFLASAELLGQQPGIIALHSLTTANALKFAFDATGDDDTRRMMLLQNCAYLPAFRAAAKRRGALGEFRVLGLEPNSLPATAEGLSEILSDISADKNRAASKILGYATNETAAETFMDGARALIFSKGGDSHDYKFSSAVLEDYYHVSPAWRNRFLASTVFHMKGSADKDTGLLQRTRAAFNA